MENQNKDKTDPELRDQVREVFRYSHYVYCTETNIVIVSAGIFISMAAKSIQKK